MQRRLPFGQIGGRRGDAIRYQVDSAPPGDEGGVVEGFGIGNEAAQLGLGLQVSLGVAGALCVGIGDRDAEANAVEQIVATVVVGRGIAHVIGSDRGK